MEDLKFVIQEDSLLGTKIKVVGVGGGGGNAAGGAAPPRTSSSGERGAGPPHKECR